MSQCLEETAVMNGHADPGLSDRRCSNSLGRGRCCRAGAKSCRGRGACRAKPLHMVRWLTRPKQLFSLVALHGTCADKPHMYRLLSMPGLCKFRGSPTGMSTGWRVFELDMKLPGGWCRGAQTGEAASLVQAGLIARQDETLK